MGPSIYKLGNVTVTEAVKVSRENIAKSKRYVHGQNTTCSAAKDAQFWVVFTYSVINHRWWSLPWPKTGERSFCARENETGEECFKRMSEVLRILKAVFQGGQRSICPLVSLTFLKIQLKTGPGFMPMGNAVASFSDALGPAFGGDGRPAMMFGWPHCRGLTEEENALHGYLRNLSMAVGLGNMSIYDVPTVFSPGGPHKITTMDKALKYIMKHIK